MQLLPLVKAYLTTPEGRRKLRRLGAGSAAGLAAAWAVGDRMEMKHQDLKGSVDRMRAFVVRGDIRGDFMMQEMVRIQRDLGNKQRAELIEKKRLEILALAPLPEPSPPPPAPSVLDAHAASN